MNKFNNISDEQLACFIDDNLSEAECEYILDTVSSDADMDVLSISYQASKLVENVAVQDEIVNLPRWDDDLAAGYRSVASFQQLSKCAFLGDADMELEERDEQDKEI